MLLRRQRQDLPQRFSPTEQAAIDTILFRLLSIFGAALGLLAVRSCWRDEFHCLPSRDFDFPLSPLRGYNHGMSRKAFFWYEFSILVGGSVMMFLGQQSCGLIPGALLVGPGCVIVCLSVLRSRKMPEPLEPESAGSRTIRK